MSSLVDELDDEDIEASLLWTDDEDGDHDTIDPLDEELLLSEPTFREEGSPQKEIFSESTKKSVISQNIEKNFTHEGSLRLNDSSYHDCANNDALETTLTDELVDLDITINTRDSLETSIVENNAKCLNETVCQELFNEPIESVEKVDECTIEIKSNTVNINDECNPVLIPTDMTEDKPADNSSSSTKPETIDNEKDVIKNSNTDEDGKTLQIKLSVNKEHARPNNNIDSTSEDRCELENKVRKEDIQEVLKEDTNKLISTDSEKKCDVNEEEENLTVIDSIESSLVADKSVIQTSENKNLQEVSENITNNSNDIHCTTPTNKQNSSQSEGDATVKRSSPIDAAIKNIRQAVSKTKRTQSLPNGEEPAQKRFRHSSEPVTVGSTTSIDNTKSVENEKSTTTNILSSETLKPDNKKFMVESEVQQPCPDQTISRNQAEVERENLDEHCDDFDLTISSSLEDKIDKNFWSTRLNFSLKFADSYSVSSKVSQLQKLCTTQSSINFKSDLKKDIADFEIFDSIADVYEDIGPPRTLENESTLNFTNDATLDLPLNVAVTENNSAEPSSMDQNINQSLNENTDSQETVCEQNDNEGRDTHSLVEEAKQNVENEDQGNINDTAGGNIQSVGEDSSQASSLYYETVPSPNQDNYMSLSDAEFQSPATSPVFAASQAYKDQIYHDLAGSLSFSLDPPSHSD
ncbi:hypothetical protein ACHWQZ_G004289 [Mnemiopsis leidyi]